jgi:hypothetical protein
MKKTTQNKIIFTEIEIVQFCFYKFAFITFLSVSSFHVSNSQSLEVPNLQILEISLRDFHLRKVNGIESEFKFSEKGKFVNYLPSVGLFDGKPTLGFSASQVFAVVKDSRLRKAKLKSISRIGVLEYNEELQRLRLNYEKLKSDLEEISGLGSELMQVETIKKSALKNEKELLEIDRDIFAIHKEAFEKKELEPLRFLQFKKQMKISEMRFEKLSRESLGGKEENLAKIEKRKEAVRVKILELKLLAKYQVVYEELEHN